MASTIAWRSANTVGSPGSTSVSRTTPASSRAAGKFCTASSTMSATFSSRRS